MKQFWNHHLENIIKIHSQLLGQLDEARLRCDQILESYVAEGKNTWHRPPKVA